MKNLNCGGLFFFCGVRWQTRWRRPGGAASGAGGAAGRVDRSYGRQPVAVVAASVVGICGRRRSSNVIQLTN